jgi:hypothetical protein
MAKAISKGDMYELRLARLLYDEGAFVRRAIDLNMRFGEDLTVTDLDILALRFADDFGMSLMIGESKSAQGKKGAKLADRLLWISGLRMLVDADEAFVATTKRASDRVRGLAERLDIGVIDERDLLHRERIRGLDDQSHWGPYDPRLLERQREVYDSVRSNQELKRVYWFIRSEFWLLDATTCVKRAFGAMRVLRKFWGDHLGEEERGSLQWLARHLQVNIVVGLVRLAGRSYREEPRKSGDWLLREFASGPNLDYETMTKLSQDIDRYVTAVLTDLKADPGKHVGALGAFNPTPPPYAEPLIEVVERLAEAPAASIQLPRLVDRRLATAELNETSMDLRLREDIESECDRLLRLIGTFIMGQLSAPPDLLDHLLGASKERGTKSSGSTAAPEARGGGFPADDEPSSRLFNESTEPLSSQ